MICYRDMTFCGTPGCKCARALTPEVKAAADKWWGQGPGEAPICIAYFHGRGGEVVNAEKPAG